MKVVVTGSSGFIGARLVQRLLDENYEVRGIDRRPPVCPNHQPYFCRCDILEPADLARTIQQFAPDMLVHLAARTDLEETKSLSGYAANFTGVENLLRAIEITPSINRCIFTSSQLVSRPGFRPEGETDFAPETLYGESKALGEKIVRARKGGGRAWCIVRPTTVWGPGMYPHYRRFFGMIKNGRYVHVGRRRCLKSWGYVGNVACQYQRLLEAPVEKIHGKVFYLADYEPLVLREWANAVQSEFRARPIPTVPEPVAWLVAKTGDILNRLGLPQFPFNSFRLRNVLTESVIDLEDTREVCGAVPYSLREAIHETIAWFNSGETPPQVSPPRSSSAA